jgi:FtsH-binding integral membrane protein
MNFDKGYKVINNESSSSYSSGMARYMNLVYANMSIGLIVSAFTAFIVSQIPGLMKAIFSTPLAYVVMFAPLIVAIVFSFKIAKMSYKTALGVFVLYSALMGLSLSFIFLVYTGVSILRVFFITSATFAAMSLYGYTTKKDLTSIGSFLIMALFGVVIASIVNIFLKSSGLQFALSLLSVFIFIGLTAYDTQKIKEMYFACDGMDMENAKKVALMGSLSLYMDFINLFIALLRFFGDKKE